MEVLYSNKDYKLNLYKQNTTIISTDDKDSMFILNELRNKGYDYVSIFDSFSTDSVEKELSIFNEQEKFLNLFGFISIKDKAIKNLSMEERAIIKIILELSKNKDLLIFYDVLTYLNKETKDKVIKYIKREGKTFINVTSNEEEFIINEYMIVLNNKMVALEGPCYLVIEQEKLLKRLGFSLPFIIDISLQLRDYGLVNNIYSDYESLVGDLWKNKN